MAGVRFFRLRFVKLVQVVRAAGRQEPDHAVALLPAVVQQPRLAQRRPAGASPIGTARLAVERIVPRHGTGIGFAKGKGDLGARGRAVEGALEVPHGGEGADVLALRRGIAEGVARIGVDGAVHGGRGFAVGVEEGHGVLHVGVGVAGLIVATG